MDVWFLIPWAFGICGMSVARMCIFIWDQHIRLQLRRARSNGVHICKKKNGHQFYCCCRPIAACRLCKLQIYAKHSSRTIYFCGEWFPLQWRHHERDGVSNHRCLDYLHNRLFRRRSKKTSKLCVTGVCLGNSSRWPVESPHKVPVTRKTFPFDGVIMKHVKNWHSWSPRRSMEPFIQASIHPSIHPSIQIKHISD